jgi:hypothetical protein
MSNRIKVGDQVVYKGCFGMFPPTTVTVTGMELTRRPREKDGEHRESVSWEEVRANRVIFSLEDGHWCYSDQICKEETQALQA